MTELPGSAAIGIEAVEWVSEGGGNLTVRVTGRWRRRRPASGGQPTLVIEAEGHRHRFPALPEPPSLTGAGPGMWQLRFSVPGSLAPDLGGRTWLQFGTVIVPLPAAVSTPGEASLDEDRDESAPAADPTALSAVATAPGAEPGPAGPDPGAHAADPGVPAAIPGAPGPDSSSRIAELERELDEARVNRDQLEASVADRDRDRRAAEQRAHAEQALRRDLARQLATSVREGDRARQAMGELAEAEHRIRTLEHQLGDARRRGDEAEQVAAAARAARERAERQQEARVRRLEVGETARLALEQELLTRRAGSGVRVPSEPSARLAVRRTARIPAPPPPGSVQVSPRGAPQPSALAAPAAAAAGLGEADSDLLVNTLRRELDARAAAQAGLRSRLVDAEARLAARVLLDQRTTALLGQLRAELEGLRDAFAQERSRRAAAESQVTELGSRAAELRGRVAGLEDELGAQRERTLYAHEAIGELRDALDALRDPVPAQSSAGEPERRPSDRAAPAEPGDPPPAEPGDPAPADPAGPVPADPAGPVEPARLNDALARLRQTVAPQGAAAIPGAPPGADGPPAVSRPPLRPVFERLVRADAEAAGRLLMELLRLQREAYPLAVSYDLVLGADRGCVCVSVLGAAPVITLQSTPRPREAVDFQVFGEPARIARLITARGLRRRFGRGVARVRGRRERVAALEALLQSQLDLASLHGAGVRLDPAAALGLVGAMVDPGWTAGERFTLAHRDPAGETTFLEVGDGRPMRVTRRAPTGRIATTIVAPADDLLPILGGRSGVSEHHEGDLGPLMALRGWINRAQSG